MARMTFAENRIKFGAMFRARMNRIKPIQKLTLADMILQPWRYAGLSDGLAQLPTPAMITIAGKRYPVPDNLEQFSDAITYGQRMYFPVMEQSDVGLVFRYICGYYAPFITGKQWDEKNIARIEKIIVHSHVVDLYPAAFHFIDLMAQLVDREIKLLKRDPTKHERMAGIDKLGRFAELTAVMFLMDSFKCSESDVMAKPYNDCLVRFMLQKEQNAYADRLAEVFRRENEPKRKSK